MDRSLLRRIWPIFSAEAREHLSAIGTGVLFGLFPALAGQAPRDKGRRRLALRAGRACRPRIVVGHSYVAARAAVRAARALPRAPCGWPAGSPS